MSELTELCYVRSSFSSSDGQPEYDLCQCGKKLKQKKNTGWANLMSHNQLQHANQNYEAPMESKIETMNNKTIQVHSWLEWICMELRRFSLFRE